MNDTTAKTGFLERVFQLSAHGTNVKTEVLAGITTFMTMAYILIVNPQILSQSGMDIGAVFTATALSSVIAVLFVLKFFL
jgi:AGZA family xanthine/uracil permease-like MFS transporter